MGGRGAKSSIKKAPSHTIDGVKYTYSDKYDNSNVNDYRQWWEDNESGGLLSDNFMATTGKEPVNPRTGTTNPKWDEFTEKEWNNQRTKVNQKGVKEIVSSLNGGKKVTQATKKLSWRVTADKNSNRATIKTTSGDEIAKIQKINGRWRQVNEFKDIKKK